MHVDESYSLLLSHMKKRIAKLEEQERINKIDIPIHKEYSLFVKKLFPTCQAIRLREGNWEWAIDTSRGWYWYPISRLPETIENELKMEINKKNKDVENDIDNAVRYMEYYLNTYALHPLEEDTVIEAWEHIKDVLGYCFVDLKFDATKENNNEN